jgi:hypothetical protein
VLEPADVVERDARALDVHQALRIERGEPVQDRERLLWILVERVRLHPAVGVEPRGGLEPERAEQPPVALRQRVLAQRPRGVPGRDERLRVVGLARQRDLRVIQCPLRVAVHHQQGREMDAQRRISRVGRDRRLERSGH